ncbi:MAG: insulinase family protein [Fimbriimonadales bacterium]|nr:insulinase family protein [Fimbriimonadales bacterium]
MTLVQTTLPNGIRMVMEPVPTVQSVAVCFWVKSGSRYEQPHQYGMAHFLEHMLFKGTTNRTAVQIAQEIEGRGGILNASTGKELTCYYARVLSEHLPIAIEVLSDLLLNARLDPDELEREKGVILEEMRMIEDTPDEVIHDLFSEVHWQGHPLGRRIIGTPETVSAFTREGLVEFVRAHYLPERVVISAAGNLEPEALVKEAERWLSAWRPNPDAKPENSSPPPRKTLDSPHMQLFPREVEQVHFCLGVDGVSFMDERRYALAVLNSLLGGSMFSRLWQEIREKRGLAYEIGSYSMPMSDGGLFVIYGGTAPEHFEQVTKLAHAELDRLRHEPPGEEETASARNQLKGTRVLALEAMQTRAELIGSEMLMRGEVIPMEEVIARIDAVTPEQIHTLAAELFEPERRTMVVITPPEQIG